MFIHDEELSKCIQSIEVNAPFPAEEYQKEIHRFGRKKLVETLVNEARLRYQAEAVLLEQGFRINKAGKWEKDNKVAQALADIIFSQDP